MKAFLSHRTRNGVLYARVLGRLGIRHFFGWFFLQTLRVRFMDFVMLAKKHMVPVSTSFATGDLNYYAQSQGWPP